LIHAGSYPAARRLLVELGERAPRAARRSLFVDSSAGKARALDQHRTSPEPTVLLSPSMREGVDLPDDFLRFQIITKMPYPDLGDPWTAARQARDPRWYALETAKALVQAYGRGCRHAGDHGTTYILDAQLQRFLARYRPLLPPWFLDAARAALTESKRTPADRPRPAGPRDLPCAHEVEPPVPPARRRLSRRRAPARSASAKCSRRSRAKAPRRGPRPCSSASRDAPSAARGATRSTRGTPPAAARRPSTRCWPR